MRAISLPRSVSGVAIQRPGMYLSDGGIVVVVSDGGVVIFRGGFGQLHRSGKRTQLMHTGVSSVISLLTVVRKGLPIPVIIMTTLHFIQKLRL